MSHVGKLEWKMEQFDGNVGEEILLEKFDLRETKNIVSDIRVFTVTSMALPEID